MAAERAQTITTFSESEADRYWEDIVAFALENLYIVSPETGRLGPLELYPHQREWLRNAHARDHLGNLINQTVVACWPKGDGKTLLVAILFLHRLFLAPGTRNYILSNSERQGATVLFGEVKRLVKNSPRLIAHDPKIETTHMSVPMFDSSLDVLPCNTVTIQGIRPGPWGVFGSDETHAAQDTGAFSYMRSQCDGVNALCAVSSQAGPPDSRNPVYALSKAAPDKPELYFDYVEAPRVPWSIRQAERDRGVDPHPIWLLKWRNAWGSKGQKLFAPIQVDACVREYELPRTWADVASMIERDFGTQVAAIGGGLDRAQSYMRLTSGDRTIWVTLVRTAETPCRYIVVQLDVLGEALSDDQLQTMTEQQRSQYAVAEIIETADFSRGLGAGTFILEQFQCADMVGQVAGSHLVAMSTQRKSRLYTMLGELVNAGRLIWSPEVPLLRDELISITVDTSTAIHRFEGRPHDDAVDGVLNALDGILPAEERQENATTADVATSGKVYVAAWG